MPLGKGTDDGKVGNDTFGNRGGVDGAVQDASAAQTATGSPADVGSGSTSGQTTAGSGEKSWQECGIDGWDNKPRDQIAREIKFQRQVYGRQQAELGQLRKQQAELQAKLAEFQKLAGNGSVAGSPSVQQAVEDMTDAEKIAFFKELEDGNPRKALRQAIGDLGIPKKDEILQMIQEAIHGELGKYHQWNEEQSLASSRTEYGMHKEEIDWLLDEKNPEAFEPGSRSRSECLDLVLLGKQNETLAGFTWEYMRQTKFPFARCKQLAENELATADSAKKKMDDLKKDVKDTIQTTGTTGSRAADGSKRPKTMDEAFS